MGPVSCSAVEECTGDASIVSVEGSRVLVGVSCWDDLERDGLTSAKDMRSGVGRVVVVSIQLSEVLIKTAVGTEIERLSAYAVVGEITEGPDKDGVGNGNDSDPNAPIEATTRQ